MVSPALRVQSNEVSCEKGRSPFWAVKPNLRDDDTAENQSLGQSLGQHGVAFRWLMSSLVWLWVKPHGWPERWCQGKGWIEQDCVVLKLGWLEAFCNVSASVLKELGMCCSCLFCMIFFLSLLHIKLQTSMSDYVKSILSILVILGKCLLKFRLHMSDKQLSRNLWQISNCGKMHIRRIDYVQIIFRNTDVTKIYTNARQQTNSFPV